MQKLKELLAAPVSGASLAAFRIAVGLVMCLEAYTLTQPIGSIAGGSTQLDTYFTGPDTAFRFPYSGFGWLPLFSGATLKLLVWFMGIAALSMAAGFLYRLSATLVFLVWSYFYALESTRTYWMSYYYLELLITFLMIWLPAARCYSLDARLRKSQPPDGTIPFWPIALLRGQLVITYFYAGVAKLNADWLLDAMPVRYYLAQPHVLEKFPNLREFLLNPALAFGISYAGAIFDLMIGFLLLIRRTRILGLVLMFIFHGTNHFVLFTDIVWFPLVGVLTAFVFLDPDWPKRAAGWIKKPVFNKPEWAWAGPGAVLLPVIGIALGWSLRPSKTKPAARFDLRAWVAPFIVAWLAWQAVFPARHYFIPGDARITFEGLAFSWRLKAEVYRANPAEIYLADPSFISEGGQGKTRLDWSTWPKERVIYSVVDPKSFDWSKVPELAVLFEPELGERIIYNPLGAAEPPKNEEQAKVRADELWRSLYGRAPQNIRRTAPLSEILDGYAAAIRARGGTPPADRSQLLATMFQMHGRSGDGQMLPFLRRMHPFTRDNHIAPAAPFLLVEDDSVLSTTKLQVDRTKWKPLLPAFSPLQHQNGKPLLVHLVLRPEVRALLPQASIIDDPASPNPLSISWDYRRDLTISKQMHISTQPFLLRRYARRVADDWRRVHGRRPEVRANTSLSLNLRPPQTFVDPRTDLASVSRKFLGHNPWIQDLQLDRIPPEALSAAFENR